MADGAPLEEVVAAAEGGSGAQAADALVAVNSTAAPIMDELAQAAAAAEATEEELPPPAPTTADEESAAATATLGETHEVVAAPTSIFEASAGASQPSTMAEVAATTSDEHPGPAPAAIDEESAGDSGAESSQPSCVDASKTVSQLTRGRAARAAARARAPAPAPGFKGRPLINWKHNFSKTHHKVTAVPRARVSLNPRLDTTFYGMKSHCKYTKDYSFYGFKQDPEAISMQPLDMEWGGWLKRLLRCSCIKSFSFCGPPTHRDVGVESAMAKRLRMRAKQRAHMQAHTQHDGAVERAASMTMEALALSKMTALQHEEDGAVEDRRLRERLAKRAASPHRASSGVADET